MTPTAPDRLLGAVQELQSRLDEQGDTATRALADQLVDAVVAMYGAGLERVAACLGGDLHRLAEDPLISTLLLIHDLHPVGLEERVESALDRVRPYMESHGGDVELVGVRDGVATIRLRGSCSDCAASSATLELAVKQALEEVAPDLEGLEVQDMAPQMPGLALPMAEPGGSLPVLQSGPRWVDVEAPAPPLGVARVDGRSILLADVEGTLLAYADTCASCGGDLHDGELSSGALRCAHCGRSFFLPAAGRSMDGERLQLDPVPLLREGERLRVALAG